MRLTSSKDRSPGCPRVEKYFIDATDESESVPITRIASEMLISFLGASALSMATPPSPRAILSLYGSTLRAARSFSSYNFRHYFLRRTKDTFRSMQVRGRCSFLYNDSVGVCPQAEGNQVRLSFAYNEAVKELEVLRRSAAVNQLYGGRRLAVEH